MIQNKLDLLRHLLLEKGCDSCILENSIDIYYFTGLSLSAGSLIITNKRMVLIADGRYFEIAKEKKTCEVLLQEENTFLQLLQKENIKNLLFDSGKTTVEKFQTLEKKAPQIQWIPHPFFTKTLRAIKDPLEQEKMRKSADLNRKAFLHAAKFVKEGVSELEIAWQFEKFCREHGATKMAFDPIIAFGENSAYPHHRAAETRYKQGDVILFDLGCVVDSYSSDMTRTIVPSEASDQLKQLDRVVKMAHQAALDLCRPGVSVQEIDLAARKVMAKFGLESYFTHSLGHGIGLETHEYPLISAKRDDRELLLEEGMIITIEPGLYVPGTGGIRHEDTIIVQANQIDNLYGGLP